MNTFYLCDVYLFSGNYIIKTYISCEFNRIYQIYFNYKFYLDNCIPYFSPTYMHLSYLISIYFS